jgi:hypothetical protein
MRACDRRNSYRARYDEGFSAEPRRSLRANERLTAQPQTDGPQQALGRLPLPVLNDRLTENPAL